MKLYVGLSETGGVDSVQVATSLKKLIEQYAEQYDVIGNGKGMEFETRDIDHDTRAVRLLLDTTHTVLLSTEDYCIEVQVKETL